MIKNNVDKLLISEAKLVDSFPSGQFKIFQFSMSYRYGRDSMDGETLHYIRGNIPTKFLKHDFRINIWNMSVEINLRKIK